MMMMLMLLMPDHAEYNTTNLSNPICTHTISPGEGFQVSREYRPDIQGNDEDGAHADTLTVSVLYYGCYLVARACSFFCIVSTVLNVCYWLEILPLFTHIPNQP